MDVVITGMGLTSARGSTVEEVKQDLEQERRFIGNIADFDTQEFQSNKGASNRKRRGK